RQQTEDFAVADLGVLECVEADSPADEGSRGAVFHAELRLQTVGRAVVDQHRRRYVIDANVDGFDVAGRELLATPEIEQHVERRMRRRARWVQLDRDSSVEDFPAGAEVF